MTTVPNTTDGRVSRKESEVNLRDPDEDNNEDSKSSDTQPKNNNSNSDIEDNGDPIKSPPDENSQ